MAMINQQSLMTKARYCSCASGVKHVGGGNEKSGGNGNLSVIEETSSGGAARRGGKKAHFDVARRRGS